MTRIVAVSDVTVGYGSPQLPLLVESLARRYGAPATIIEPAQPELPPMHASFPDLAIRRIVTAEHPHSTLGRMEYVWRAARLVNELGPEIFVICCTYCLPVAYRLKQRPKKVIYYSIESIPFYGDFDIEMNRRAAPLLDVVIFPEENRAVLEIGRCGFPGVAKTVLYNVSGTGLQPVHNMPRNGRILYSGTISRTQTFADYYLSDKARSLPVDMYGSVRASSQAERDALRDQLTAAGRYRGVLHAAELAETRKLYAYSIVAWNPDNENQLYAAPNKFFEAITDGVPPIAAPHPQCKLLLDRYRCGILMADWSFDAFLKALRKAVDLYGGPEWQEMVANCARAVESELTWDAQFHKLRPYL
jgi:glycosyltransferase involved in cell wall biosynthesis